MTSPGFLGWAVFSRCDKLLFELHQDLFFVDLIGHLHKVPAGYVSDLGSVPRLLWPLLPPHEYPSSYFLHDYGYSQQDDPREIVDLRLYDSLLLSNAPKKKSLLIYKGVAAFGGRHWQG